MPFNLILNIGSLHISVNYINRSKVVIQPWTCVSLNRGVEHDLSLDMGYGVWGAIQNKQKNSVESSQTCAPHSFGYFAVIMLFLPLERVHYQNYVKFSLPGPWIPQFYLIT